MNQADKEYVAQAAAHEWDMMAMKPALSRQRFIDWHVKMAEEAEQRGMKARTYARACARANEQIRLAIKSQPKTETPQ